MTTRDYDALDPKLDLVIERFVDVPRALVWRAWTEPEHLKKWFTPAPWTTDECEIDLRPGGIFRARMRGPEGEESNVLGCYLEVVEHTKLVWTIALLPGFRPLPARADSDVPTFTAVITFQEQGKGTKYTARAMHVNAAGAKQHADMGFHEGWGAATDQLVQLVTKL